MRLSRLAFLILPLFILIAGCDLIQVDSNPGLIPTLAATTAPTTTAPQVIEESLPEVPAPVRSSTVRLWIPPEIGTRTEAGAQELISQLRAFETGHNDLEIIVEQKPVEGAGGILNYLQTGRAVAPTVMPDIVAVPTSLLVDARMRDLFYPLEALTALPSIDGVYPGPAGQVINGSQILGYPFATMGVTHLIFEPDVITQTIPMRWTQFISDTNHTLVLPADSREGAMLGLQFYLAQGGTLVDGGGKAALEAEPLSRALAMIGVRKENLLQSHQLKTLDEAWQYHQLGLSNFMWMRSEYLLSRQAIDPSLITSMDYSAVPGVDGPLVPLTTSWAWAVTIADPVRQALAAELIAYLTLPENLASWTSRSQLLPAQRQTMSLLSEQDAYMQFAAEQMELAQPMPVNETSRLMDVLGDAVFQVLTTEVSPVLIAEQAVVALRQ